MQSFDVIIVGGGLMGLSLAARLKSTDLSVAILDRAAIAKTFDSSTTDNRVFAITRQSEQFFQRIGVWDAICDKRVSPYSRMQVWDSEGSGQIEFDARDLAQANLGYIIENSVLQSTLYDLVKTADNITLFEQASAECILVEEAAATLPLEDQTLEAKLIVAADGANSWVREQLQIPIHSWDYEQHAIVASVVTEKVHEKVARQRFMPKGPLAFLPLLDSNTSSIVWSTEVGHAKQLMSLDTAEFKSALADAFDYQLGEICSISQRFSFPLRMRHAKQYTAHRVALVGDAAHTIHPLAGQGANLGIADVSALADCLIASHAAGKDLGSHHRLRRFERARKGENWLLVAGMESFKQGFGKQIPWLRWARNAGLNAVDQFVPLKRKLMRKAMGIT